MADKIATEIRKAIAIVRAAQLHQAADWMQRRLDQDTGVTDYALPPIPIPRVPDYRKPGK